MPGLFVTATGTEVGKTYVTAALIRAGRRRGISVGALKPIMTGFSMDEAAQSDAAVLLDALGLPITRAAIAAISPWRFSAPLAPNMAAAAEGARVDFEAVVEACRNALSQHRLTLIEGIGGAMVPIDERHTVLDLIAALTVPVLLVTGSQLGALSHCLTAYEALRLNHRPPALIILNESAGATVSLGDTRETLTAFCQGTPIVVVPRDAGPDIEDTLLQAVLAIPGIDTGGPGSPSRRRRTTA